MAKRLTDSRKWQDPWFRTLPPPYREFWSYVLDTCNHAGIWKVDMEMASFCLGTPLEGTVALGHYGNRVVVLSDEKWFIPKFVKFQYQKLNPSRPVCRSVLEYLESNLPKDVFKEHIEPLRMITQSLPNHYPMIKSKTKSMSKSKDKDIKYLDNVYLSLEQYSKLEQKLGKETTDRYIERLDNYISSKGKKYKSHYHTILMWADKDSISLNPRPTQAQINTMASLKKFKESHEERSI